MKRETGKMEFRIHSNALIFSLYVFDFVPLKSSDGG